MSMPPLHLRVLFHPKSDVAQSVALQLLNRFVESPSSVGLRIPTFFGPDNGDALPPPADGPQSLDLDIAKHTIVVLLADVKTVRDTATSDTGPQWQQFARQMTEAVAASDGRHHFFVAALDAKGFGVCDERHIVSATDGSLEEQINEISLHISVLAITLLRDARLNANDSRDLKAPVSVFLSHAKADLGKDQKDCVTWVLNGMGKLPIQHWFDSSDIAPNENFEDRIQQGLRDSAIVVVFLTDHFSSRPWCRREVLEAKRLGIPLIVVDALNAGEPRSFPYLGNVPTIRWDSGNKDEAECQSHARAVVDKAIRESLRNLHNSKLTQQAADGETIPLSTAPELLLLASDPLHAKLSSDGDEVQFVYPDPPLSAEELEVLARLIPHGKFETPLSRIASNSLAESVRRIAVSISDVSAGDLRRHGLSLRHFEMMSDELHLYLLLAGGQIGYGGALSGPMTTGSNFTLRLFELVRGYSSLARNAADKQLEPIINSPPWPLSTVYTDDDLDRMTGVAKYAPGPEPTLDLSFEEYFPEREDGKWRLICDTAGKRFAWSRGLTEMRQMMNAETDARVLTGGKMTGFSGAVPGLLEEAWIQIQSGKPLFLVGAFGGIAGAIVDLLEGRDVEEFTDEFAEQNVLNYKDTLRLFAENKVPFVSAAQMATDIRASAGERGIAATLNNGLMDEENQELFRIVDPATTAELILSGLRERIQQ